MKAKKYYVLYGSPVMKSPNLWGSQVVNSRIAELKKSTEIQLFPCLFC